MKIFSFLFLCTAAFAGSNPAAGAPIAFVLDITEDNADQLHSSNQPVILKVYAPWCSACKTMAPVFSAASDQYSGTILFAELDIEAESVLAKKYSVTALPTTLFFKPHQKRPVMKVQGSLNASEFEAKIQEFLKK